MLAGHSPTAILTATEAAVSEGTPCALHPATAAVCATLWPIDTSITIHTMTPTTSYIPSHTCHFSHKHHSCYSTYWSWSCSSNSHCTAPKTQPRKAKQHPRLSIPHKSYYSKTVAIQDSPLDSSSDSDSDSDPLNY